MIEGKTPKLFRILLVLYLAGLSYLCLGHFSAPPSIAKTFLGIDLDKIAHFLMFLPFPLLAAGAFGRPARSVPRRILRILGIFLAGCLLAAATETAQSLTTWRSADPADFRADGIGLAVSTLLLLILSLGHPDTTEDDHPA